jgi:hypothetical protein
MIPGSVSKLTESSVPFAATIRAKTDILHIVGAGTVQNIIPGLGTGQSQFLVLNSNAATVLGTTGNIAVGLTMVANRPVFLVFSRALGKWLINSGV